MIQLPISVMLALLYSSKRSCRELCICWFMLQLKAEGFLFSRGAQSKEWQVNCWVVVINVTYVKERFVTFLCRHRFVRFCSSFQWKSTCRGQHPNLTAASTLSKSYYSVGTVIKEKPPLHQAFTELLSASKFFFSTNLMLVSWQSRAESVLLIMYYFAFVVPPHRYSSSMLKGALPSGKHSYDSQLGS